MIVEFENPTIIFILFSIGFRLNLFSFRLDLLWGLDLILKFLVRVSVWFWDYNYSLRLGIDLVFENFVSVYGWVLVWILKFFLWFRFGFRLKIGWNFSCSGWKNFVRMKQRKGILNFVWKFLLKVYQQRRKKFEKFHRQLRKNLRVEVKKLVRKMKKLSKIRIEMQPRAEQKFLFNDTYSPRIERVNWK